MEIKELRWFLVIAEEGNMTRAAERLHITQPTLSKQMKLLESDLGQKLFARQSFGVSLTDAGKLLHEEARDLIGLADRIEEELVSLNDVKGGCLHFGLAESYQIRYLAAAIKNLRDKCPELEYHVMSGVSEQVVDKLDKGIIDFAVLAEIPDETKYETVPFPGKDKWGLIMPSGCKLSSKERICFEDLLGKTLLCSAQGWKRDIGRWCGKKIERLKLGGSFGLAYNGAVFVREGLGYLLALDKIVDTSHESVLTFRPLDPPLETTLYLAWKKGHILSPIARKFLGCVEDTFGAQNHHLQEES